ncbi:MAG: MBL fold metallo-hydrolase [Actinobacteria bacterium]|nr:MBL fold metallo-hydrolase [Actinomycetota bacterium]
MRIRVWGCRGSLASPGPETVRYGGNTSCLELRMADESLIVLDAGTGIRGLGVKLTEEPPPRIDILLTHLHLDHVEGLGFFGPLWRPDTNLHIWGPPSPVKSLSDRLAILLSPPLFPVHLNDIPSQPVFHDIPEGAWELGGATFSAQPISHPGPTVGYRIEENGKTVAYMPDHEPALGVDLSTVSPDWISGYGVASGADLLFHDSQYTEEEYSGRVGWGHSSTEHVVTFSLIAKVQQLVMFHHDPYHSDADLEAILVLARELWGKNGHGDEPILAREGMEIDLGD